MSNARTLFLVVDDELDVRRVLSTWLKHHGFEVIEAEDVRSGVQAVVEIGDLFMVASDLQVSNGTARDLHQQVGHLIEQRRGLFTVTTGSHFDEPRLMPYGRYFAEHDIRVFHKPVNFRGEFIPFLEQFRDNRGG